jgi:hypothetical protein
LCEITAEGITTALLNTFAPRLPLIYGRQLRLDIRRYSTTNFELEEKEMEEMVTRNLLGNVI